MDWRTRENELKRQMSQRRLTEMAEHEERTRRAVDTASTVFIVIIVGALFFCACRFALSFFL